MRLAGRDGVRLNKNAPRKEIPAGFSQCCGDARRSVLLVSGEVDGGATAARDGLYQAR